LINIDFRLIENTTYFKHFYQVAISE